MKKAKSKLNADIKLCTECGNQFDEKWSLENSICRDCANELNQAAYANAKNEELSGPIRYNIEYLGDGLRSENYTPLTQEQFDQLSKRIQDIDKGSGSEAEKYSAKLWEVFSCHDKIYITTLLRSPDAKKSIDVYPKHLRLDKEFKRIYNDQARQVLVTAGDNGEEYSNYKDWFIASDNLINDAATRMTKAGPAKMNIVVAELKMIKDLFPEHLDKKTGDIYRYFGNSNLTGSDKANQRITRSLIYKILSDEREVDFKAKLVSSFQHVIIIRCQEIYKYYKWLEGERQKLESPPVVAFDVVSQIAGIQQDLRQLKSVQSSIEKLDDLQNGDLKAEFNFEKELDQIKISENKFWKGIGMSEVVTHFSDLTVRKNNNGQPFLSEQELISFLKKGFLLDDLQPIQKINSAATQKGYVISCFQKFYELATSKYNHPNKKAKFIDQFVHCFDNWSRSSVEAYFKPGKRKETW